MVDIYTSERIDDLRRRVEALERATPPSPPRNDLPAVIAYMTAIVAEFPGAVTDLRHEAVMCPGDGSTIDAVRFRLRAAPKTASEGIVWQDRIHARVERTAPAMVGRVSLTEMS